MEYFAGIDIGSLATKAAIIDSNGDVLGNGLVYTGAYIPRAADRALQMAMECASIAGTDVKATVTTGYGRKRIQADEEATEIRCHARGVYHFFPRTRTIKAFRKIHHVNREFGTKG